MSLARLFRRRTARQRRWRLSLKGLLLSLLLPGMLASLLLDSYSDYQTLARITRQAYDNALHMPVNVLARSVRLLSGGELDVDTRTIVQRIVEPDWDEPIYFQILRLGADPAVAPDAAVRGSEVLFGRDDFPLPMDWEVALAPEPLFYDGFLGGQPVRVAAQVRRVPSGQGPIPVLVQAAQSSAQRMRAEQLAVRQESWRDLRALAIMVLLLWLGVSWGLRPLARLRADVAARRPEDATPLDASAVPQEVVPLVDAVNHHIARHRNIVDSQSQFLADASHQLRTPLTIMLTQAEYALRERDPVHMRESLTALVRRLGKTRRLTEQLLNLALARHASRVEAATFDVAGCARDVLIEYLPLSEAQGVDLGWDDAGPDTLLVRGHEDGIREAVSNLVHNALQYSRAGGTITVSCRRDGPEVFLTVVDDGPGVDPALRSVAFERFERLNGEVGTPDGAGLGLAIARAFVRRDGGDIWLEDGEPNRLGGVGLKAVIRLIPADVAMQHRA
ncbi:sensor histidine kinase [Achromobacter sp. GG226]|uniref:sensor histidine kinase n=1 Tax=Verticiella alkaliphila TaxID=2779529 RepID=UPI001C0E7345|nr:sensor histidine kinase [Verticiella sp. GG226]MBU4610699.1 sensor histidine kinase [Verticiella sp. GG226]